MRAQIKRWWASEYTLLLAVVAAVVLFFAFSSVLIWPEPKIFAPAPNDKIWDWFIAVVGTLLSFIVALAGATSHLRARRKKHLCHLLTVEFDEPFEVGSDKNQPTWTHIHPLAVEEAVKSGLFNRDLTKYLLKLAKMYHEYNDLLSTLRERRTLGTTDSTTTIKSLEHDITKWSKLITRCRKRIRECSEFQRLCPGEGGSNDPLRNPDTALGKLDEDKYRAERDLVDRYQAFVAELLRLSLLGIAVFGFLYKIIFESNLLSKLLQTAPKLAVFGVSITAPELAAFGVLMFGISAFSALGFRFFAIGSLGLYIQALRFKECTPSKTEDAEESLNKRHRRNLICTGSKAIAAVTLALGGLSEALAVFLFIFELGRQTGA
jgi:hypothetical protein